MDAPGRKILCHDVPLWVDPEASDYFITICCRRRGADQLCLPNASGLLLSSARFYHQQRKWFPSLLLLMPDHLHMLVGFSREHRMEEVVRSWKRYTAKQAGIEWQHGFFEHRLRSEQGVQDKAEYILQNPVRAGLMRDPAEWPHVLMLD